MHSAETIRSTLRSHSQRLDEFGVSELWVFGSAARADAEIRDLDFLVSFHEQPGLLNFMGLRFFLEALFQLPVDLHSKGSCPDRFLKRIQSDLKHVA